MWLSQRSISSVLSRPPKKRATRQYEDSRNSRKHAPKTPQRGACPVPRSPDICCELLSSCGRGSCPSAARWVNRTATEIFGRAVNEGGDPGAFERRGKLRSARCGSLRPRSSNSLVPPLAPFVPGTFASRWICSGFWWLRPRICRGGRDFFLLVAGVLADM